MRISVKFLVTMIFCVLFSMNLAQAAVINFVATNLDNTTPGEDLWEYSYIVSENTFLADTGFTIFFDGNLYGTLDPSPLAPNLDWDVISWLPDPNIPGSGAYDAYALSDGASLADPFTISFVWLGAGTPGAQPFELYSALDPDAFLEILESGTTVPTQTAPVPEPTTILLLSAGLVGLIRMRGRCSETA